jgi:hypothetical protein
VSLSLFALRVGEVRGVLEERGRRLQTALDAVQPLVLEVGQMTRNLCAAPSHWYMQMQHRVISI